MDRHGNVRVYVRRPGRPKVRIRDLSSLDAFMAAYRAAQTDAPVAATPKKGERAKPGTFRWLTEVYLASAEFKQFDDATKTPRRRILERIGEAYGNDPYALIELRHV